MSSEKRMGSQIRGIDRRPLIRGNGLAAAGVLAPGLPLVSGGVADADPASTGSSRSDRSNPDQIPPDQIPPDTLPGGAYDRYVAQLAAEGQFSGRVLLSHRGRTVLSRGYGLADEQRGIRNHE